MAALISAMIRAFSSASSCFCRARRSAACCSASTGLASAAPPLARPSEACAAMALADTLACSKLMAAAAAAALACSAFCRAQPIMLRVELAGTRLCGLACSS